MNTSIEIRVGTVEFRDNWLVVFRFNEEEILEVEDIQEMVNKVDEHIGGNEHCVLVLPGSRTSATFDAMKFARNHPSRGRVAEASVISSLSVRLLSKFYHAVIKPPIPSRYFQKEAEAMEWLEAHFEKAVNGNRNSA
jgi:hypothetical protein